ncbi:transposase (plasmid) [Klebsiella sp. BDA134-6]|nr:transposase [Klebsiella sp. BDA134-6]
MIIRTFWLLRYVSQWTLSEFKTLDEARDWANKFIDRYNAEHCHSGTGYVSPE